MVAESGSRKRLSLYKPAGGRWRPSRARFARQWIRASDGPVERRMSDSRSSEAGRSHPPNIGGPRVPVTTRRFAQLWSFPYAFHVGRWLEFDKPCPGVLLPATAVYLHGLHAPELEFAPDERSQALDGPARRFTFDRFSPCLTPAPRPRARGRPCCAASQNLPVPLTGRR